MSDEVIFELDGTEMTLRVETDLIPISTNMPQRDPHWKFTDEVGHEHRAVKTPGDLDVVEWPSLQYVPGPEIYCSRCNDIHEDYEVSRWVCRDCMEPIQPGTFIDSTVRHISGMKSYYLNGEPITEEKFHELSRRAIEKYSRQSDE
jgi:hypothetical protein